VDAAVVEFDPWPIRFGPPPRTRSSAGRSSRPGPARCRSSSSRRLSHPLTGPRPTPPRPPARSASAGSSFPGCEDPGKVSVGEAVLFRLDEEIVGGQTPLVRQQPLFKLHEFPHLVDEPGLMWVRSWRRSVSAPLRSASYIRNWRSLVGSESIPIRSGSDFP